MTPIENNQRATTVREIKLNEFGTVHGVTCDNQGNVWFAEGDGDLICVAPGSGRVIRHFKDMGAQAGTAFDGTHIWQLTPDSIIRIDTESGEIVRTLPAPKDVHCSGMAFAEGALWIGDFNGKRLIKVDIESGEIEKRLTTDRFVTGVSWSDESLWHGAWDKEDSGDASLRRLDPDSGEVLEDIQLPDELKVSGLGQDNEGRFWCGGGYAGGLQAVRTE